jgi:hypothetical protein
MADAGSDFTLADLQYDLDGTRAAEARLRQFFGEPDPGAARVRGATRGIDPAVPLGPSDGVGRRLVLRHYRPENQRRYAALLRHEAGQEDGDDHGLLVGAACVVLESELGALLTRQARPIADDLVALLRPSPASQVLREWQTGASWPTLGTHCLVLSALRRGLEQGRTAVRDLLRQSFDDAYLPLLRSNGPARCLEQIRRHYRNPALHGFHADGTPATFGAADYAAFADLMVASAGFRAWDQDGPRRDPPGPDVGVLHHHLCHTRSAAGP